MFDNLKLSKYNKVKLEVSKNVLINQLILSKVEIM